MSARENEGDTSKNGQENRNGGTEVGEGDASTEQLDGAGASHSQPQTAGTLEQREAETSTDGRTSESTDDVMRFPRRRLSLRGRQYRRRSRADESSGDEQVAVSYVSSPFIY